MSILVKKHCVPCQEGTEPLSNEILAHYLEDLAGDWVIVNDHHIEKEFHFKDFKEALNFANRIGDLAEAEGHHPDIHLSWGKVRIIVWTHKINGLTANDFILASKIDTLN